MSGKRKQVSPLVEAAQAFDEALEAHARAAELFVRSSLSTTKQLERANELLGEIAAAEQRMRDQGAALATAVTAARDRQEQITNDVVARLPLIKERNQALQVLIQAFAGLGAEAASLNASATTATPLDFVALLDSLAAKAAALAGDARTGGFEELANQAHALHQRLAASARKLQSASLG